MRAMCVGSPATLDSLKLTDRAEIGRPGPGEIAIRLRGSSLNYHDYLVATGAIPNDPDRIPMSDGAGTVAAVGDAVTTLAIGDEVVSLFHPDWPAGDTPSDGFGTVPGDGSDGYAREAVIAPAYAFTRAPRNYDAVEAATLTCAGLTAWRALVTDGPTVAGQTVLVQGTGGVSVFALQFAKMMGAIVIATSSSDEKLERLRALGADHVINYKTSPDWGKQAHRLTGGVDHVVEIGGPGTLPQSIAAIRQGGHIALIGVLTGFSGEIPTAMLMMKQGRLEGVTVGSRRDQIEMIAAIEANGIRPVIDRRFKLEELADAFRYQESGLHFGKIGIEID